MKNDTPFILECPECGTQYEIPVAIPEGGRKVRCAKCEHVWTARSADEIQPDDAPPLEEAEEDEEIVFREEEAGDGEAEPADEAGAEIAAAAAGEAEPDSAAEADQEPEQDTSFEDTSFEDISFEDADGAEPEESADGTEVDQEPEQDVQADASMDEEAGQGEPEDDETGADIVADFYGDGEGDVVVQKSEKVVIGKARRQPVISPGLAAGWGMLCLAIAAIGYIAITQRVAVVRILPGSAWAYARIGLPVNIRGLDFADVAYTWESEAGRVILEVHGDIVNVAETQKDVPSVVFALRGENDGDVFQWEYDVVTEPLAAGARATFAVRIPTPPKSIKSVQVRFAKGR